MRLVQSFAVIGAVALLMASCAHHPSTGLCSFSRDAHGILSDHDLSRGDINRDEYSYVRDLIVENVNYSAAMNAIATANRDAETWVTAIFGTVGDSDFGIVHVAILADCRARYVVARSGERVDFDIEEGVATLRSCVTPEYISHPDIAAQSARLDSNITISHPTVRFLLWKEGGRSCGSVVEGNSNLGWFREFRRLEFLDRTR